MSFRAQKSLLVIIAVFLLYLEGSTCSIISLNINNSSTTSSVCIGTDVLVSGRGNRAAGCAQEGVTQSIAIISSPAGANPSVTEIDGDAIDYSMNFDVAGMYTIQYTYNNAPSCANSTPCVETKVIEVIDPRAKFTVPSIEVCKESTFSLDIEFLNSTSVTVRRTDGIATFSKSIEPSDGNFGAVEYDIKVEENFKLYITRAQNDDIAGNCENVELLDSVLILAIDEPLGVEIFSDSEMTPFCDDSNENYQMKYKLTGGSGQYTLVTQGEASISGDTLTTNLRPSGEPFSITINSGPVCGDFLIENMFECACRVDAGDMPTSSFSICQEDFVTLEHDDTELNLRGIDNLLFVLHTDPGNILGDVLDFGPEPIFKLPALDLVDSLLFVSALVGPYDPLGDTLDLTTSACFDLVPGTPVRWISDDEFTIIGKDETCLNDKNRMYEIQYGEGSPKETSVPSWILEDESGAFIESQNSERIFLTFPNGSQSTLYFETEFLIGDTTCISRDSMVIEVDATESAPEDHEIILWPGDIFASTSDGPCYQWGFVNKFGEYEFNLFEGANEKYFFSPTPIGSSALQDNGFFVAIYDTPNCEFSLENCNNITFYNQNLIPGLGIYDEDDFIVGITPNPNDGTFRLELTGSYKGRYDITMFDDIGQKILSTEVNKLYSSAIKDLYLSNLNEGLYIIVITNELGRREILKTVVSR